jgi:hypothetical protein
LLIIADGPRESRVGEAKLVAQTRAAVERVDWPCEVVHEFAAENMGCRRRVSSGLDAAFKLFDRAIVLEDDVLPEPGFFPFCQAMLDRYADDERVMMVSGFNPLGQWQAQGRQYHYSMCGSIWGWASWRRAWRHYDVSMRAWADPAERAKVAAAFGDDEIAAPRLAAYQKTFDGQIDTWDYQWSFARARHGSASIVPAVNLVENIGFRADATHTRSRNAAVCDVPTRPMTFPIRFHDSLQIDRDYDRAFTRHMAGPPAPRLPAVS